MYASILVPLLLTGAGMAATGKTVRLEWEQPPSRGSRLFYKLFRSPAVHDYLCQERSGANPCSFFSETVHAVRKTSALDRPGPGRWTYRVGVAANWVDDPQLGDVFLLSEPVMVTVP